jgi:hypothetical protein
VRLAPEESKESPPTTTDFARHRPRLSSIIVLPNALARDPAQASWNAITKCTIRCSIGGALPTIIYLYLQIMPILPCLATALFTILVPKQNGRLCKFASTARLLLVRVIIDLTFSHVRLNVIPQH